MITYIFSSFDKDIRFNEVANYFKNDMVLYKNIVFIPANFENMEKVNGYANINVSWFKEIGINLNGITVLNDTMTKEEMFRSIENADIIFLMGGDTLKQNDFLMKNDLKPIIKTFKKVVIGISAGAINLSNISLCSKDEEDGVEKTITYEGIGRINYTIEPHFDIDNKILLQNELYPLSEKMTIYGLPNNTGVRIIDSNFEILYGDFYTIYKKSIKNII